MLNLRNTTFFLFLIPVFLLSGCTKNFKSALGSVQAAIELSRGTEITTEYIKSLPYASSLVTVNDAQPILLILAYVDKSPINNTYQLTWLSADKGTIVTENGRIIHTTGFDANNLESLSSDGGSLPLPNEAESWLATYDWSPGYRFNFTADVNSRSLGITTISTDLWTQEAEHIQEHVSFGSLNSQFKNDFWVAPETKNTKAFVVKSIQYLGPKMDKVEMLMMRPFFETISDASDTKITSNTKDSES
jgi:hypothetical protein